MKRTDPNPYRYFVTFAAPGGLIGNSEIRLHYPIRSQEDINVIGQMLAESGYHNAVVTGWQRFETVPVPSGCSPARRHGPVASQTRAVPPAARTPIWKE
ncbi:hypothetical protein AB0M79_22100 [Polymorphospora sp. NPDC051019]|uniref:hypothetical protein n=1 Tax=Polymorphospora sp. NPDC051019 TaxID=3155725 RepID=UPI0034155CCD